MVSHTMTMATNCSGNNSQAATTAKHWQPNEPPSYYISFYVEITIVAAIGVVGNSQLIALFYRRHRKLYRAVNLFMLLLATIDLTACLWTMPYAVLYVAHDLDSEIACKAGFYISGSIEMMSMVTSTIIASERLRAVRNPHRPPTSKRAAFAHVAGVAGLSFAIMSGLIACMTIDEQGECSLNASRPPAAGIYLVALSAVIALIYIGDFVLYALIFAALRRRARMAERRRNTLSSVGSGGTLRHKPSSTNATESAHETGVFDHSSSECATQTALDTGEGRQLHRKEQQDNATCDKTASKSADGGNQPPLLRSLSVLGAERQDEAATTDRQPPSSARKTNHAGFGKRTADGFIASNPVTAVSYSKKRSSLESEAAEHGAATRKLHLPLPLPAPKGLQRQRSAQSPSAGSPPTSPGANGTSSGGAGRLSWSAEVGRNWAAQDVRSSAFLVIVLLSLVSWLPFFLSISFPSALGMDMPHYRFLFFLNHITNVFVYMALSPHIRAQLKASLLRPMRQRQARRGKPGTPASG